MWLTHSHSGELLTRFDIRCHFKLRISALRHFSDDHFSGVIEKSTPRIRAAVSLKERKQREKQNRILLEGWRLVNDALLAKAQPVTIFYSDYEVLKKLNTELPSRYFSKIDNDTMQSLSSTVTAPGIVGVFKRPRQGDSMGERDSRRIPLTVVCDGLRDPTNIGSLVRVSAAAGCELFITSKGCADVWEPKVLRCAAGGHFHLPIHYHLPWTDAIKEVIPDGARILVADSSCKEDKSSSNTQTSIHYDIDWAQGNSVLVIGGETTGVSDEAWTLAHERGGQRVHIPMAAGVDSLSAAAAGTIIIYEALRQIHKCL